MPPACESSFIQPQGAATHRFQPRRPGRPKPRALIASASSSSRGCDAAKAIDGNPDDANGWLANAGEAWLRIDLGSPYLATGLGYQPRQGKPNGRIGKCGIYVTDSTSNDADDWGCPVWRNELANTSERKNLRLEHGVGRYVIIAAESAHGDVAGANEIQVYGACDFAVVDAVTGCPVRTNSRTVNVAIFNLPMPEGKTATRFQITQGPAGTRENPVPEPTPPTEWLDAPPKTFTIQAKPAWTHMMLHAWAATAGSHDSGAPPTIVHVSRPFAYTMTRSSPNPKNITVRAAAPGNTAVVTVEEIGRGSWHYGGRIIGRSICCPQDITPANRDVTLPGPGRGKLAAHRPRRALCRRDGRIRSRRRRRRHRIRDPCGRRARPRFRHDQPDRRPQPLGPTGGRRKMESRIGRAGAARGVANAEARPVHRPPCRLRRRDLDATRAAGTVDEWQQDEQDGEDKRKRVGRNENL